MKILFAEPFEMTLFCFRKELLDSLISEGHEIYLCINATERINKYYFDKVKSIININIDLKDKNIFSNIKLKNTFKKIIRLVKPDLILSFTIKPNIYCGFAAKKIPMIANITGLGNIFEKKGMLSKIGVFLYKIAFKNIDCVFFQNQDSLNFFNKHKIPVNHYKIIPGSGVNVSNFVPTSINKDKQNVEFLFASRLIKEKGFDLLLEAIPFVLEKHPNARFIFLCSKKEFFNNSLASGVYENFKENIIIFERTNDMRYYYAQSDFLVSPSFYREGISNVLLESLSSGRPIITTDDNPGCMEVLQNGVNGIGVKSNDLKSLVEALNKAASLPKNIIETMGLNGRDFVSKKFNRLNVIEMYLSQIDVYKDFYSKNEVNL